jgi:hypothetical protein
MLKLKELRKNQTAIEFQIHSTGGGMWEQNDDCKKKSLKREEGMGGKAIRESTAGMRVAGRASPATRIVLQDNLTSAESAVP